ncbi:MAG TPA: metal ABC transporter permease [Candidatus Limnocylindrales bacterium]|nr:metal ABC transporter permease [Candidatus Limnocylindrales bacterium]
MNQAQIEIQVVAAIVAAACALPGCFLVLRRMALISDAISHTVLLGIVLGFMVVGQLGSPLLILGAALVGILTVALIEVLFKSGRVKEDAAIALVFPALFSVAVILISQNFRGVHLDTDVVLLGELAFAPFSRTELLGVSLPRGVIVMGAILLINVVLLSVFYKELKLATFDRALAASLGFAPALLTYGLTTVVSVTAVGAFEYVGSVLVVALMIAPPAAAYLLTNRLSRMLGLSVLIAVVSAIAGFWVARALNINLAGTMASITGLIFLLALVFAPERGLVSRVLTRRRRKARFAVEMLVVHLSRHEHSEAEATENSPAHLTNELLWAPSFAEATVRRASANGLLHRDGAVLHLTESGRALAVQVEAR